MKTRYISPTGKHYDVKQGWSWTLFLFVWLYGAPFWFRRMYSYGAAMVMVCLLNAVSWAINPAKFQTVFLFVLVAFYYGMYGNKVTASFLEAKGWRRETEDEFRVRNGWPTIDPETQNRPFGLALRK